MFCTLFGKTGKIKSTEFGRSLYDSWRQHFDSKSGLMIAGVMGGIIWFINSDHGILPATTAALKQMAYTVKMCESLAVKINNRTAALMLSMLVPSAITILATYTVHSLKRTPEPLNSTIPTMIGSPIFLLYWGWRKVKRSERQCEIIWNTL